jgi:hypothetical protein
VWEALSRHAKLALLFFLPYSQRKAIDRRLRGREEFRKLHRADWLLVSWGKSGRTWLRVMLSRVYQLMFDLPDYHMLDFDNLNRMDKRVPRIFFTHGNYLRDYTGHGYDTKIDFMGKKIVFLVRDPRDVAVSQYFQWRYRMRPHKKRLNDYPPHGEEMSVFDFVMYPEQGLPRIISYFNAWLEWVPRLGDVLVVRYEDMRADPGAVLAKILDFTGTPASDEQVRDAVEFAAFDNLKKMEEKSSFPLWRTGLRLVPGEKGNPNSYKVRRAKVGGYRDYFTDDQIEQIDAMVEQDLDSRFGYDTAPTVGGAGARRQEIPVEPEQEKSGAP